jgi:hypothetical protein
MKLLLSLLTASVLCFTACAQFTTNPPGVRAHGFTWTTNRANRVPDHDTRNFISRAGLNNPTQIVAVVNLVRELRAAGIWPKLTAFYPFVGGTSNSCSQNLVSSRFPITWSGPITFNTLGITGDGTNYGNTGYAPSLANSNSFHLYGWIATNATSGGPIFGTGMIVPVTSYSYLQFSGGGSFAAWGPNGSISLGSIFSGGNFLMQRTNSTKCVVLTDSLNLDNDDAVTIAATNSITVLAATAINAGRSQGTLRAFSIGASLTHSQSTNYFAIVNRFQTALGRGTP